ncbi:MAG TPA: hypothetical protein VN457_05245, partial [Chlamydiales bacterium]|nr:hypothetical protein [Chlamydiales bacterium]
LPDDFQIKTYLNIHLEALLKICQNEALCHEDRRIQFLDALKQFRITDFGKKACAENEALGAALIIIDPFDFRNDSFLIRYLDSFDALLTTHKEYIQALKQCKDPIQIAETVQRFMLESKNDPDHREHLAKKIAASASANPAVQLYISTVFQNGLLGIEKNYETALVYANRTYFLHSDFAQVFNDLQIKLKRAKNVPEERTQLAKDFATSNAGAVAVQLAVSKLFLFGSAGVQQSNALALEYCQRASRLSPENISVQKQLGSLLRLKGDLDGALALFFVVLLKNPADKSMHGRIGEILRRKGLLNEAEAELKKSDRDTFTLSNLADIKRQTGELREAKQLIREALQCCENDAFAQRVYREIAKSF